MHGPELRATLLKEATPLTERSQEEKAEGSGGALSLALSATAGHDDQIKALPLALLSTAGILITLGWIGFRLIFCWGAHFKLESLLCNMDFLALAILGFSVARARLLVIALRHSTQRLSIAAITSIVVFVVFASLLLGILTLTPIPLFE